MMDKLLPCPFCGGEAIVVKTERCGRYIGCWDCGGRTEEFETDYAGSAHDKAIAAWNRRAQPANAPLTLDELRGMVGEWVWVEHMDSPASQAAPGEWLKLKTCEPTRFDPYIWFDGERKGQCSIYYGQSWLAYRHKPEEVQNER